MNRGSYEMDEIIRIENAMDEIGGLPLEIDDRGGTTIDQIAARAEQTRPALVIIDYLQLLTAPRKGMTIYESVTYNSGAAKAMAKNLGVPVLMLSQLNRAPEIRRKDYRPQMSDLRESGAIEQDADKIWLLHRLEAYGIATFKDASPTANRADLILAKNRNGDIGAVRLTFLKEMMSFENLAPEIP